VICLILLSGCGGLQQEQQFEYSIRSNFSETWDFTYVSFHKAAGYRFNGTFSKRAEAFSAKLA